MSWFYLLIYVVWGVTAVYALIRVAELVQALWVAYRLRLRLRKARYPGMNDMEVIGVSPGQLFTTQRVGWLLFFVSATLITVSAISGGSADLAKLIDSYAANGATELAGLALTILLVDRLYDNQNQKQLREQLVREMVSKDSGIAQRAINELRAHGWLQNGSLRGVHIEGANLARADLRGADLRNAHISETNFSEANMANAKLDDSFVLSTSFKEANLANASLKGVNGGIGDQRLVLLFTDTLRQSSRLIGAIMPDGSRYDGRYRLKGDLYIAREWTSPPIALEDSVRMAEFYGVNREAYTSGQELNPVEAESQQASPVQSSSGSVREPRANMRSGWMPLIAVMISLGLVMSFGKLISWFGRR